MYPQQQVSDLNRLYDMIDMVIENQTLRIATGVLNEIMTEAVAMQQPPSDKGKRLKLYYITQVAVKPPTFVIFVNDKELMHFSYTRYLENKIREAFGFRGTSLKFFIRENGKEKESSKYGTIDLSCGRICVRSFSDRISGREDEPCRYQKRREAEIRERQMLCVCSDGKRGSDHFCSEMF